MKKIIKFETETAVRISKDVSFDPCSCSIILGGRKKIGDFSQQVTYPIKGSQRFFLNITSQCNMACDYCYASALEPCSNENFGNQTLDPFLEYLRNDVHNSYEFNFFGGEPLLKPDLIEEIIQSILHSTPSKKVSFSIITNGTILNEKIESLLKKYSIGLTLSIDGKRSSMDIHRKMRNGEGSSRTVLKNLRRFISINGFLSVRLVITSKNLHIYENVKFLNQQGVKIISFRPVYSKNPTVNVTLNKEPKLSQSLNRLVDWYLKKIINSEHVLLTPFDDILSSVLLKKHKTNFCSFGEVLSITADGSIFPCSHLVNDMKFQMGDVKNMDLVKQSCELLVEQQIKENFVCRKCWLFNMCGGGCKAASNYYFGSLTSPDDSCNLRKEICIAIICKIVKLYKQKKLEEFLEKYVEHYRYFSLKRGHLFGERYA